MTTAGRPYCNHLVPLQHIAAQLGHLTRLNHLKGVIENYVLTARKPKSRSHWRGPFN